MWPISLQMKHLAKGNLPFGFFSMFKLKCTKNGVGKFFFEFLGSKNVYGGSSTASFNYMNRKKNILYPNATTCKSAKNFRFFGKFIYLGKFAKNYKWTLID